jgi:DNA-binding NarL/FixJ family response regulator
VSEEQQVQRIPLSADIAAEALAIARRELDPAAYETAWRQGQSMATAEAVADALAVLTAPPTPDEGSGVGQSERPAGLTASELRVLRLLASGRTTQQIADDLVVAISTVERHITHIYGKIGVRGRAAATAFALREGLLSDRPAG